MEKYKFASSVTYSQGKEKEKKEKKEKNERENNENKNYAPGWA